VFGREIDEQPDERGATAVEYGLMVAFIAIVIVGGVTFFGTGVKALFELIPPSMWP
jgi:pilus assembly protein Flp/PilA